LPMERQGDVGRQRLHWGLPQGPLPEAPLKRAPVLIKGAPLKRGSRSCSKAPSRQPLDASARVVALPAQSSIKDNHTPCFGCDCISGVTPFPNDRRGPTLALRDGEHH